jgi:Domain of unknown function (DUF3418)
MNGTGMSLSVLLLARESYGRTQRLAGTRHTPPTQPAARPRPWRRWTRQREDLYRYEPVEAVTQAHRQLRDRGGDRPEMQRIWRMIEELRVSYFAQELRTPYPVSDQRIYQAINELAGRCGNRTAWSLSGLLPGSLQCGRMTQQGRFAGRGGCHARAVGPDANAVVAGPVV